MKLIKQNPYHVLGILADSNQRTISRQKSKINALRKVGKKIAFDNEISLNGEPDRSENAINQAFSDIAMNQNRLFYALFWFINYNHLDETALNYLQSGDYLKAEEIWKKSMQGKPVTKNNLGAYNNLGTLKLANVFSDGSINYDDLKDGVFLKSELITSEFFKDFTYQVADETYTIDQSKELESFFNTLVKEIEKNKGSEAARIPAMLSEVHPELRTIIYEKYTNKQINNINSTIEVIKNQRNEDAEKALKLAKKLYNETKDDISSLVNITGKSDLKYKMVADKLAKEILQCGIDYFQEYRDREEEHVGNELGEDVMKYFKIAQSIAVSSQTKERISENVNGLQEWIDNADWRRKQKLIAEDIEFINNELENFDKIPKYQNHYVSLYNSLTGEENFDNIMNLISSCKPKIKNIGKVLGKDNDLYLKISSAIVSNAQGKLVEKVNRRTNLYNNTDNFIDEINNRRFLKNALENALEIMYMLQQFDMSKELQKHFSENFKSVKSLANQLDISTEDPKSKIKKKKKNAEIELSNLKNKIFYKNEYKYAKRKLDSAKKWQLFRSENQRIKQIKDREEELNKISEKAEQKRNEEIKAQNKKIKELKSRLKKFEL